MEFNNKSAFRNNRHMIVQSHEVEAFLHFKSMQRRMSMGMGIHPMAHPIPAYPHPTINNTPFGKTKFRLVVQEDSLPNNIEEAGLLRTSKYSVTTQSSDSMSNGQEANINQINKIDELQTQHIAQSDNVASLNGSSTNSKTKSEEKSCCKCNCQNNKRSNIPGDVDHTMRVDVRGKTMMRKLSWFVRRRYTRIMKGKKQSDRFFKFLHDKLQSEFPSLVNNQQLLIEVFSPIAKMILKKAFEQKVKECTLFSESEQSLILEWSRTFKMPGSNFQTIKERRKKLNHPVFRLAKSLINKNDMYEKEFWQWIIETRSKPIADIDGYKQLISKDMATIPALE